MGYDMWWRRADERDTEKSYFRLNIWTMSRYLSLMLQLGMVFEDEPCPDWPDTADYGITDEQVWAVEWPEDFPQVHAAITPEVMGRVRDYRAARDRVLAWHSKEIPGIPLHKFSTNDGWIVLPAECRAAARIWRSAEGGDALARSVLGDDLSYWHKWIAFLVGAATHDGFEVH